jgi:hypothetical protein
MPALRQGTTPGQAADLCRLLRSSEQNLRTALVGTRGLQLKTAGHLSKMICRLQAIRWEVEGDAERLIVSDHRSRERRAAGCNPS